MLKQDTELRPDFTPPLCKIIVLIFYKQGRNLKMKDEKKTLSTPGKFAGVLQRGIAGFRAGDSASLCRIRNSAVLFVLSFVLSAAELSPGVYPFGTAVLCAVNGSVSAAVTFSGAVLGTLGMQSGALWQILVLSAAFIARVCAGVAEGAFSKKKNAPMARLFHEAGYVRVTICAAAAAGAGIVTIVSSTGLYSAVFSALLGLLTYTLSCGAFVYLFDRSASGSVRAAGVCIMAFALSTALDSIALPFSPVIIASFAAAVYFTWGGGIPYGAAVALSCGLACGAQYAPLFAIAAVVFGLLCEHSVSGAIVLSALCGTLWALMTSGLSALSDTVPEICLAAAVFIPLLKFGVIARELPSFLSLEQGGSVVDLSERKMLAAGGKYGAISSSLSSLSKMLYSVCDKMRCPTDSEAYRICTAARARYCCGCPEEERCSGECEREVSSFFDNMSHRLAAAGKVSARIVPDSLARRCHNIDSILDAVNTSAKRAASMSASCARTELFAADYSAVSELLREVAEAGGDWDRDTKAEHDMLHSLQSDGFSVCGASVYGNRCRHIYLRGVNVGASSAGERDITKCAEEVVGGRLSSPEFSIDGGSVSAAMHTVPAISVKTGRYSTSSVRDNASGDSICSFKNDEGYFYTLVSDGMGSGRDAAIISGISSMFLEKLLSAGCPMKSALEMLNCFVRGSDGERFTTVDLMEADLYTGRARFIKSGAAPSFVIRGGQLYRLHSKTVPVGIMRALDAEAISFNLEDGDTVIMMSDGVTGSYEECPWLYDLLCSGLMNIDNPAAAARIIGEAAVKNTGRDDDITVCVMKVSKE